MSIEMMVRVYKYEMSHSVQSILLAMADHANDEGENCYPSVDLIAWKTGYERRQVQRIMKDLRKKGALKVKREATATHPTDYKIVLEAFPPKQPFVPSKKSSTAKDRDDILSPLEDDANMTHPEFWGNE
jgi:hypothetical protein